MVIYQTLPLAFPNSSSPKLKQEIEFKFRTSFTYDSQLTCMIFMLLFKGIQQKFKPYFKVMNMRCAIKL